MAGIDSITTQTTTETQQSASTTATTQGTFEGMTVQQTTAQAPRTQGNCFTNLLNNVIDFFKSLFSSSVNYSDAQKSQLHQSIGDALREDAQLPLSVADREIGVRGSFYVDFKRGGFSIKDSSGKVDLPHVPDGLPDTEDTNSDSINRIRNFIGNDAAFTRITNCSHQGIFASFLLQNADPELSPMKLNGTKGSIGGDSSQQQTRFTLEKLSNGNFRLHAQCNQQLTFFQPHDGGRPVILDTERSKQTMTFTAVFDAGGNLIPDSVTASLSYNLKAAAQQPS